VWKQTKVLLLFLVIRKDMGIDPCGIVGGGGEAGLRVNNNNNDANENNGVGGLRKFCDTISSLNENLVGNELNPSSYHFSYLLQDRLEF
jgi:hypothetical protein